MTRREWLGLAALGAVGAVGVEASGHEEGGKAGRIHVFAVEVPRDQGDPTQDPLTGAFVVDPETGQWEKRAAELRITSWSSVEPDGRNVASFEFAKEKGLGVWVVDATEGERRRIVPCDEVRMFFPRWSGDGRELIVRIDGEKDDRGASARSYRVRADGSKRIELPIPGEDVVLDWSPDGQWLLVAQGLDRPDLMRTRRPVDLVGIDGKKRRRLIDAWGGGTRWGCRFSPDSRRIAYALGGQFEPAEKAGIWTMDLDGGHRRCVLAGVADESLPSNPVWSPDGSRLAVMVLDSWPRFVDDKQVGDFHRHIETLDADGSHRRRLELPLAIVRLLDWR